MFNLVFPVFPHQVMAVKDNIIVVGIPTPVFEKPETDVGHWSETVAGPLLEFLLSPELQGKVETLINEFTAVMYKFTVTYIKTVSINSEEAIEPTLELSQSAYEFFSMVHTVKGLQMAHEMAEALPVGNNKTHTVHEHAHTHSHTHTDPNPSTND